MWDLDSTHSAHIKTNKKHEQSLGKHICQLKTFLAGPKNPMFFCWDSQEFSSIYRKYICVLVVITVTENLPPPFPKSCFAPADYPPFAESMAKLLTLECSMPKRSSYQSWWSCGAPWSLRRVRRAPGAAPSAESSSEVLILCMVTY